jgi:hypothetical protein
MQVKLKERLRGAAYVWAKFYGAKIRKKFDKERNTGFACK